MPYGIKNETPKQSAWMEKCVNSVMGGDKKMTKSRAIAICKVQLQKSKAETPPEEEAFSEMSLNQIQEALWKAIGEPIEQVQSDRAWIVDVFDSYVIVEKGDDCYEVSYSFEGDEASIDWTTAKKVVRKVTYEPVAESTKIPDLDAAVTVKPRRTFGSRTI